MMLIAIGLLGLILGSFINAFVWRLHQQELARDDISTESSLASTSPAALKQEDLSIITGRSMCTECHHILAAKDLIPVVSWLLLRGRCRYCRKPISWQYPFVEVLTSLLFIASYVCWPLGSSTAGIFLLSTWLVCVTAFMTLVVYDIRWFLLPDRIVFPLIAVTVLEVSIRATIFHGGLHTLLPALLGAVCISGLFFVLHIFSRGTWIGFGDVKLSIALGLLVGSPAQALLLLFLAAMLGTLIAIPLLVRGQANARTQLPFGPFLIAGTIIAVLFGTQLIHGYLRLFSIT